MSPALVLGLGGGVDYELEWDPSLLEELARRHAVCPEDLDARVAVVDERTWVRSLLAFVDAGQGGERSMPEPALARDIAAHFRYRETLGGTAVRAAVALGQLGVSTVVHVPALSQTMRRLLPRGVRVVAAGTSSAPAPHLIVQYPAGASVTLADGSRVTSAVANRVIYVADPPNREMCLSTGLPAVLATADSFLISGFNAVQDEAVLRDRLTALRGYMASLRRGALVYYEDAGFHRDEMRAVVQQELMGLVDVHGLNEDELQEYIGRRVDLLDPADVAQALVEFAHYRVAPTVVLHTREWALAYGPDARSQAPALQSGIDLAATRFAVGDNLSTKDVREMRRAPLAPEGSRLSLGLEDALGHDLVCCLPARHVTVDRATTIGLGDTFVAGFLGELHLSQKEA